MSELGGWSRDELARLASVVVGDEGEPGFYAVAGSHIYGFAADDSDVDLRGFHVADAARYLLLDQPAEQLSADPERAATSTAAADVDVVSYELRTFATHLARANFTTLELVFDGLVVADEQPADLDALRSLVEERLPLDVPSQYVGMARHQYERSVAASTVSERPSAKEYLYGVRGLLAAHYVAEERTIESDVRVLSDAVLGDTGVVDTLVAAKRGERELDGDVASDAERLMGELLETAPVDEDDSRVDKADYRAALDEWMLGVRGVEWG
ncbi:Predicted nucleotidyltransferase [Halogranum gelatinilyticum]|uniref:Predicted nucleotidyltransferase n=1 Tax=Halogranum gelatinilyticum TaxID=660521 RepID=A0A1G9PTC8_9EURY|nr:nucleotidyltransferase domain-containing protein [Halogranum gelatinilyticum]SDM02000.1 Predicted nucleotidyltransferase [Halogranum gelatinilyticum]